jgi:predicted GH43/DUF377 family glycosyl hydrolase
MFYSVREQQVRNFNKSRLTQQATPPPPAPPPPKPPPPPLTSMFDYNRLVFLDSEKLIPNDYHYNACICKHKSGYRMFYRTGSHPKMEKDRIATCLLTSDFKIVTDTNKLIETHTDSSYTKSPEFVQYNGITPFSNGEHSEDPRVVEYNGSWFLFYTDGYLVGVAKLELETCDTIYTHYFKPQHKLNPTNNREKNWIPYVDRGVLSILYKDSQRTILKCKDLGTSLVIRNTFILGKNTVCQFGEIRGGCPPVEYDNYHFIWFFHTFYYGNYTIGAYITRGYNNVVKVFDDPIMMGQIQPEFKTNLIIKNNVVYPCGAVRTSTGWTISMGINDYKIALLHINFKEIKYEYTKVA